MPDWPALTPAITAGLGLLASIAAWVVHPHLGITGFVLVAGFLFYTLPVNSGPLVNRGRLWLDGLNGLSTQPVSTGSAVILVAASMLVVVFRNPDLLVNPRFWAEDGRHFFEYAFHHRWLETLFIHPDYRLILSNLAAIIAVNLPLEYAPLPFELISMAIIGTAVGIVAFGRSPLWNTPLKKILVAAIILFEPSSEEIWLNGNGTQYYTALVTALVLCESRASDGPWKRNLFRGLLFVSSLNGILACLLTPLFGIKAWQRRDREALIQTGILVVGSLIQVLAIVEEPDTAARRVMLSEITTFGWIAAVKSISLPFDIELAHSVFSYTQLKARYGTTEYYVLGILFAALWLAILSALAWRLRHSDGLYLLASMAIIFSISCVFGIAKGNKHALLIPLNANRYFFIPGVLLLVSMVAAIAPGRTSWRWSPWSAAATFLVVLSLVNGIHRFYQADLWFPEWKRWEAEVEKWRDNPDHALRIWPNRWRVRLDPEAANREH